MLGTSLLTLLFLARYVSASNVWTVNCQPLTIQQSDPIVSPGQKSGHTHAVVGGTAFNRTMGPDDAAKAKATTCDKFTDRSNYWCPQLYEQIGDKFKIVPFRGANMYYTNYTCDYDPSGRCPPVRQAHAFPPGLRMLAGDSARRTYNESDVTNRAILFVSGAQSGVHYLPTVKGEVDMQAQVRFPSCWDGVNLDSTNHKSHVTYPDSLYGGDPTQGGICPKSHPVSLINIGAEFGFDLTNVVDMNKLVFANGDNTGRGFHADFIQGWTDPSALEKSFSNCFDNNNCPWRAFGTPDGKETHPTAREPETKAPMEEDLGLNGLIAKLPGNNPVFVKARRSIHARHPHGI